tara:strand:+ start:471 stop:1664 length:1194 start_codon:yes stop_codon:yes gene_type:complete
MSEINLNESNETIIHKYFQGLVCDDFTKSIFTGGQSVADDKLNNLDITGYAKKRNNVYPSKKRGSSYLSPYIRHGLLSLKDVWHAVENFTYEDKTKFRDELLWQEFSRHLYAVMGKKTANNLNFKMENTNEVINTDKMNCINTIEEELTTTGYMVNQTRMWYSSHKAFRSDKEWNHHENFMFKHLVDGSRFANRLGWQWVMGNQTGKLYGFAQSQVKNRAKSLCEECSLQFKCPIVTWPDGNKFEAVEQVIDFGIREKFGPQDIMSTGIEPEVVWLTGESLGDDDPAMKSNPNLPVLFIFDSVLLNHLQLSTKRINFLIDTLKELSNKKNVIVHIDDPKHILKEVKYASTYACVPKYKEITKINQPVAEFPTQRLAEPIDFYPRSYTSWKKKIKLTI